MLRGINLNSRFNMCVISVVKLLYISNSTKKAICQIQSSSLCLSPEAVPVPSPLSSACWGWRWCHLDKCRWEQHWARRVVGYQHWTYFIFDNERIKTMFILLLSRSKSSSIRTSTAGGLHSSTTWVLGRVQQLVANSFTKGWNVFENKICYCFLNNLLTLWLWHSRCSSNKAAENNKYLHGCSKWSRPFPCLKLRWDCVDSLAV